MIARHETTRHHAIRFGGGLPPRPAVDAPPDEPGLHESRYIRQLLNAYGDHLAAPLPDLAALGAHAPMQRDFVRQRERFYSAEALRNFSRDTVPEGTFDALQEEVFQGVVDVSEAAHETGFDRMDASAARYRESVASAQRDLDEQLGRRRELAARRNEIDERLNELVELDARFRLLGEHYAIDLERLRAIQESGTLLAFVELVACPLCGAAPDAQHVNDDCDGNVAVIVEAATAEIGKIDKLQAELASTILDLGEERGRLARFRDEVEQAFQGVDGQIRQTMAPEVEEARSLFTDVVEARAAVRGSLDLYDRLEKLERRRSQLDEADAALELVVAEATTWTNSRQSAAFRGLIANSAAVADLLARL